MKVTVNFSDKLALSHDALVLGILKEKPEAALKGLPKALRDQARSLLDSEEFRPKLGKTAILYHRSGKDTKRLLLLGLGKKDKLDCDRLRRASASAAKKLRTLDVLKYSVPIFAKPDAGLSMDAVAGAVTEGALLGLYRYDKHKTKKDDDDGEISAMILTVADKKDAAIARKGVKRGQLFADAGNHAKALANTPANEMSPDGLAREARKLGKEAGLKVTVLDEKKLKTLKMNGILAVGQGSVNPPRLIIMEHSPKGKANGTIVLVGKGITFDSGGLSLKPPKSMEDMKFDKCGACAVVGAMGGIAGLNPAVKVVGIVGAAENMPSGTAQRPGDVITMYSGKTVEVLNTDAEGRLVLADSLAYAAKYKPNVVIDVATLTGACQVALGKLAAGLLGNDDELLVFLEEAGYETGEMLWQLPLWDEYSKQIKGDIADINNIGTRGAGTITAAAFLKEFTDYKWAHIDIAGTAYDNKHPKAYVSKGATGFGARLFMEFAEGFASGKYKVDMPKSKKKKPAKKK